MTLDIQDILARLDRNDTTIFSSMNGDPAGQKELVKNISWLIPQWMTGAHTETHHRNLLIMFEQACNGGWGSLYKHPELQAKLLATVGSGKTVRHRFFRPLHRNPKSYMNTTLGMIIRDEYPDIKPHEIILWCNTTSTSELDTLLSFHNIADPAERKEVHRQCKQMRLSR